MEKCKHAFSWVWEALAVSLFVYATAQLTRFPRGQAEEEMSVVLPRFVQVLMTGGDRYLAANVAVVRSLRNNFSATDTYDHYVAQARIQADAAWFNPRHEDNYYIAAALLSWSGHTKVAEQILEAAADGRPFDMLPPFFLGFDYYYFDQNPTLGAQWMYMAARRADSESNRISLSRIAARWAERGSNAKEALGMVRLMLTQARGRSLKQYLTMRYQRLEGLVVLQEAARVYQTQQGLPLARLEQLVQTGLVKQLPVDPLGLGYVLDAQGTPQLVQPTPRGALPVGRK